MANPNSSAVLTGTALQLTGSNLDETGVPTNQYTEGEYAQTKNSVQSSGPGTSLGNSGGWSVAKGEELNCAFAQRGIAQAYNLNMNKYAVGDSAGFYAYVNADAGLSSQSDEGVVGFQAEVSESAGQFTGTIESTKGTGDISPALRYSSGPNWLIDGSFLLNLSRNVIVGSLAGPSVSGPSANLNYWPVTDDTSLPITAAWGNIGSGATTPYQYQIATQSAPYTRTVTLGLINGVRQPFVSGVVTIAGNAYPEQALLTVDDSTTNSVSEDGLTQVVTLHARNPNDTASIFQGGLAGYFFSADSSITLTGQQTCYYIFGSLTGKDLIYGINKGGSVGLSLPYPNGSMPWTTSGPNSGFHLYSGAEIVANQPQPGSFQPILEPNNVAWVTGDQVSNPKYPVQGGRSLWVTKVQHTTTNPDQGSYGIDNFYTGAGVTDGFYGLRNVNGNGAALYGNRGTAGVLSAPTAFSVVGEHSCKILSQFSPGPGEVFCNFTAFANHLPPSQYTAPITLFQFDQSQSNFGYNPAINSYVLYSLTVYDLLNVSGQFRAGIVQTDGVVPQGGSYGQSQLMQCLDGGFHFLPDPNRDVAAASIATWAPSQKAYLDFKNQSDPATWSLGKNADNSFSLVDSSNSVEVLHANANGRGITAIQMADTFNGHAYLLQVTNGAVVLTQTS